MIVDESIVNSITPTRHLSDKLSCSIDFTTLEFPAADQFDVFRETHKNVADLELVNSRSPSFPARQIVWDLNRMVFTYTKLPGDGYSHRWQHLKRTKVDHWYLLLPFQFADLAERDECPAAEPSLHCLAKPFESETDAQGCVALYVPRDILDLTSILDQMANIQFGGGIGSILADYLLLLNRSLPSCGSTNCQQWWRRPEVSSLPALRRPGSDLSTRAIRST